MHRNINNFERYSSRLSQILSRIDCNSIEKVLNYLNITIQNNGVIYVLGNGGSASTASHFVNDLTVVEKRNGIHVRAHCLSDNHAVITAISNDESFDYVFLRQIEGVLNKNDLLFMISVSGNSRNLLNAAKYAIDLNINCVSLLGFDGGMLKALSKEFCLVPTKHGEYGPAEDAHMAICHHLASRI
jgi:D-sedoheptulose 7-phosphate isomerase